MRNDYIMILVSFIAGGISASLIWGLHVYGGALWIIGIVAFGVVILLCVLVAITCAVVDIRGVQ